jgi:ParB family transcriptional regulator, chromosome partitioning protein
MNGQPQTKRRALGRGLDALIPSGPSGESPRSAPVALAPLRSDFFLAPIESIHPSPEQPRQAFEERALEELAQSIRSEGVIQPLVVRERGAAQGGGFWLIAGERRWRAAQRAGLHEVPVVVREATAAKAFELALVENIQRADLNPIEEALAYRRLCDEHGYTQEQVADRVGKDRTTIANALRLLKLPPLVRSFVQDGTLSMGHARALLGLESLDSSDSGGSGSGDAIEAAARRVKDRALSVRATEELVRKARTPAPAPGQPYGSVTESAKSASVRDLEQRLCRALGARVAIRDQGGNRGGTIEIRYANLDDLDRILDRLQPAEAR